MISRLRPARDLAELAAAGSVVAALDPRARVVAAATFSVLVAVAGRPATAAAALAVALGLAVAAQLRPMKTLHRLLPLEAFMLAVLLLFPLVGAGERASLGPIRYSPAGLRLAVVVAMKGNAIVLAVLALLGTLDIATLGHTLRHLRVPAKLAQLLLYTERYLEVLSREYHRLLVAAKTRAFSPGVNRHSYRTFGYLAGMVLVRSLDRADRIDAAMRCRGFDGRFHLLEHFAFARGDAVFGLLAAAALGALALLEWWR